MSSEQVLDHVLRPTTSSEHVLGPRPGLVLDHVLDKVIRDKDTMSLEFVLGTVSLDPRPRHLVLGQTS